MSTSAFTESIVEWVGRSQRTWTWHTMETAMNQRAGLFRLIAGLFCFLIFWAMC